MPNNLEGQKGSRIFTYNIKIIKVMSKQEKEIIRQDLMECVGHYVNDVQLEIYIESLKK